MIYLDTSVLVSAFRDDEFSERTLRWLGSNPPVVFSQWTLSEFSSALGNLERQGHVSGPDRRSADAALDEWTRGRRICGLSGDDVAASRTLVREGRSLRAGDALHLAVAARHGYEIATFDRTLAQEASRIGLSVVDL